jgi:SAM-dependent methyltransferase
MHQSSLENMARCYRHWVAGPFLDERDEVRVLDLGGADFNGSYRSIFCDPKFRYLAADISPGEGVGMVLDDPYRIPLADGSADIVISGQVLEHCEFFWLAFQEMVRVTRDDGFIFLIAPSAGAMHRYPVDCYRFHPDAFAALAKYAGCRLDECWQDERGEWEDVVGVFSKGESAPGRATGTEAPLAALAPADPGSDSIPAGTPEQEAARGTEDRLVTLDRIHYVLRPRSYVDIGAGEGGSLRLARGAAVGVDPRLRLEGEKPQNAALFEMTSDDFFELEAAGAIAGPIDVAFVDGMHLFEHALRDFMNLERLSSPAGLIVVDGVLPRHPDQAERVRKTRLWAGDVWRLPVVLAARRPGLILMSLDVEPTGLLLIAGLDPTDRTLWDDYNSVVRCGLTDPAELPRSVIERADALDPLDRPVRRLLGGLRRQRDAVG